MFYHCATQPTVCKYASSLDHFRNFIVIIIIMIIIINRSIIFNKKFISLPLIKNSNN